MASRKNYFSKTAYRFFPDEHNPPTTTTPEDSEFDESDLWGASAAGDTTPRSEQTKAKPIPSSRSKKAARKSESAAAAGSLPVNVPDWSKILRAEYRRRGADQDGEGEEREAAGTVPPHEYLARTRIASSFSVHEGIGRTLKGRDLSRVRNAIWEKTGFED